MKTFKETRTMTSGIAQISLVLFASTMLLGSHCTPAPTPPTSANVADAGASNDPCTQACANLVAIGRPEGSSDGGASCVATCQHTQATKVTDLKPSCLAGAKSKADARACGSVACP